MKKMYVIGGVFCVLASLLTCACDTLSGRETAGEYIDDTGITARVKAAILDNPNLKSYKIKVITMKNVVQLSGFVDSETEKREAGEVASEVSGVKKVENNLIVRRR